MNVDPHMNAGYIVVIAPLNTSAPECSTTDSGAMRVTGRITPR